MVYKCITTPSMRILFNVSMTNSFRPSRGIRQGDPFSPYLFVLRIKRLGHLIQAKVAGGVWKGIKCSKESPAITHLFFADDLLLFGEATLEQIEVMESCLAMFCDLSGQKVSLSKSHLCVSKNVCPTKARALSTRCGVPLSSCLEKYLGNPFWMIE